MSTEEATSGDVYLEIMRNSWFVQLLFSLMGAVLNVFHLIVISRKSMMTSSINVIMIGIACCDLFLVLDIIRTSFFHTEPLGTACTPPPSLFAVEFNWVISSIHSGIRQCSAWLAVLLTLLTFLIISDITNQHSKFAELRYGYKVLAATCVTSLGLSLLYFSDYELVEKTTWRPMPSCDTVDIRVPVYILNYNEWYFKYSWYARFRLLLEGVVIRVIPCLLLPTLTVLLIHRKRKAEGMFGGAAFTASNRAAKKVRKDRYTVIVIFIAITFILSEFPSGFVQTAGAIWLTAFIDTVNKTVAAVCNVIFTANSSIHCLIYFTISRQYRKTVHQLTRVPCWKKHLHPVITVPSIRSLTS